MIDGGSRQSDEQPEDKEPVQNAAPGPDASDPASPTSVWSSPDAAPAPATSGTDDTVKEPVWWNENAQHDPWRSPSSEAGWIRPTAKAASVADPPLPVGPQRAGHFVFLAVVIALVAGLIGGGISYGISASLDNDSKQPASLGSSNGDTPALAKRPPDSVAGIVEKVQPSVVTIDILTSNEQGNGSGLILSKDGYMLTNNHVAAAGGAKTEITVLFHDGSAGKAKVIGTDPGADLAVIQVPNKKGLTPVQFGDSDKVRVGDPAVAFGAPLGLSETVTSGIVSAIDRPVLTGGSEQGVENGGDEAYMAALQTDAPINPGNSGGPLVDGSGNVIGVNSAIASVPGSNGGSIGLGFAIPINQAKRIAEQIISDGKARRTVIGVGIDQNSAPGQGVRLSSVDPNGPASQAGLRTGDVVTNFDGKPIEDPVALIALIRKRAAGDVVKVKYRRGNKAGEADVTLVDQTVQ